MKIVIIGAATGGMTAAAKIKRSLKEKVKITAYQKLAYPSLGACGLPYFVGDNFSDSNKLIARTVEEFDKSDIKVHVNHEVVKVDFVSKKIVVKNLETNKEIEDYYDKLIISTGAKARELPNIKYSLKNVYKLNQIEDAVALKAVNEKKNQNITVIGGGFIGLEAVENMQKNNNITLLEATPRLSQKVYDAEIGDLLKQELIDNKVNVITDARIKNVVIENDEVKKIILEDGTEVKTDAVLVAIGVVPNTEFLKGTLVKLNEFGAVIVNEKLETNIKDVYSLGDCALTFDRVTKQQVHVPLATIASKQGKVLANVIMGKNDAFQGSIGTSIIQVFEGQIARTGLTEDYVVANKIPYKKLFLNGVDHTHYVQGAKPIYVKVIYNPETKMILGAQIYGYNNSVLRINSIVPLIWNQTNYQTVRDLDLPYSPPFAKSFDIMNVLFGMLGGE